MITDLFEHMAKRPNSIAFVDDEQSLDYGALSRRVGGMAGVLQTAGPTVGILEANGIDWVVAYLAAMFTGKTIVPLPPFFSNQQLQHIIADAGVDAVLGSAPERVKSISPDMSTLEISEIQANLDVSAYTAEWQVIIYTSGTTGAPKGVRLGSTQVSASVLALAATILPGPDDRYLSILPFSLLLEQITGILLPIHVGACSFIASGASLAALGGDIMPFIEAVNTIKPSITVLVPNILEGWVKALGLMKAKAPASLRFVAVGGAHVPMSLTLMARDVGVPAFEGYGLSECCSVVAVNAPGADRPGSVGRPLPTLSVTIEQGEIIVDGPAVMSGYLGREDIDGRWHTGDMGFLDEDGFLHVQGRADNMLVTSLGRNVTPEWIEAMITADKRIRRCIVIGQGKPTLSAVVVPSMEGQAWFDCADSSDVSSLIEDLCREAPTYARPGAFILVEEASFLEYGFVGDNGRVNRHVIDANFCSA